MSPRVRVRELGKLLLNNTKQPLNKGLIVVEQMLVKKVPFLLKTWRNTNTNMSYSKTI